VPCNIGFGSCVTSAVCGGSSSTTMALRMRIRGDGRWRSSAMAPPTEMASAVFSLPVRSIITAGEECRTKMVNSKRSTYAAISPPSALLSVSAVFR
jgi:hypothetical protein